MHILLQDSASKFLGEHLLLTISALKEKCEGCSDVIRTGQQVREWVFVCISKLHATVVFPQPIMQTLVWQHVWCCRGRVRFGCVPLGWSRSGSLHQKNQWIYPGEGFISSFDAQWSEWSRIIDLIWIIPKKRTLYSLIIDEEKERKFMLTTENLLKYGWLHHQGSWNMWYYLHLFFFCFFFPRAYMSHQNFLNTGRLHTEQ